jgi:Flp pilus assembly protein TadD
MERGNEAIRVFNKSLEIDPLSAKTWYDKGVTLKELNMEDEATRCFEKVLELEPTHTLARHKLKQM